MGASDGEAVIDLAGAEGGEGLNEEDNENKNADRSLRLCGQQSAQGKQPRKLEAPSTGLEEEGEDRACRVSHPLLSFGEFIQAHQQGCFVCYGRSSPFQHDHRPGKIHKADTKA